jgi:hypothetical protein
VRYTCAHCPHLVFKAPPVGDPIQTAHAECGKRVEPVPQSTKPIRPGYWLGTFWRISIHCPLPNHIVDKSADIQPMARWERRVFARAAA